MVDIVCFRKLGHNEQDTPALTQPLMYKKIAAHPGTRKLYGDKLVAQGVLPADGPDAMVKAFRAAMDAGKHTLDPVLTNFKSKYAVDWQPFLDRKWTDAADTALPLAELKRLAERITTVPANFKLHPLVEKVIADRAAMGRGEINVDWGMGEHLAFASLVASGYAVRLSGEDSGRGTFTHRHAVLHDQNREKWDEGTYIAAAARRRRPGAVHRHRLAAVRRGGARLRVRLRQRRAEHAGDLGGAVRRLRQRRAGRDRPVHRLGRGQVGPRQRPHADAAARLRRPGPGALARRASSASCSSAADNNMQVVQPTTASQIFHVLRRQMVRMFRKPLVIMTPKSLLRDKDAALAARPSSPRASSGP